MFCYLRRRRGRGAGHVVRRATNHDSATLLIETICANDNDITLIRLKNLSFVFLNNFQYTTSRGNFTSVKYKRAHLAYKLSLRYLKKSK